MFYIGTRPEGDCEGILQGQENTHVHLRVGGCKTEWAANLETHDGRETVDLARKYVSCEDEFDEERSWKVVLMMLI